MGEDGQIKCDSEEVQEWISPEDKVSMNMWAGYPEFLDFLAEDFKDFLENVEEGDLKSEYLLPNIVDKLLKEERANVKVLETQDRWFGVTYKEDKETVQEAFRELISDGVYAEKLWEQVENIQPIQTVFFNRSVLAMFVVLEYVMLKDKMI